MLSLIKKWLIGHRTVPLLIALFFSFFFMFLCYRFGSNFYDESRNLKQLQPDEVTEENFPYHALDYFDSDESNDGAISIDLNDYEERADILTGGTYLITGTLKGCLYIRAKDETVHLLLKEADIESDIGPALIVEAAEKVIVTLVAGTSNQISDSGLYREAEEYESCIQSNATLTFNGTGTLEVYGLYKDGIRSKDSVKIADGEISIYSKRTAIHGTDGIYIAGGKLFIASEKNGFKTTKNGMKNRGALMMLGGEITVIAGRYSFVSEAPVYIFNCTVHENSTARFNNNNIGYVDEGCFNE